MCDVQVIRAMTATLCEWHAVVKMKTFDPKPHWLFTDVAHTIETGPHLFPVDSRFRSIAPLSGFPAAFLFSGRMASVLCGPKFIADGLHFIAVLDSPLPLIDSVILSNLVFIRGPYGSSFL